MEILKINSKNMKILYCLLRELQIKTARRLLVRHLIQLTEENGVKMKIIIFSKTQSSTNKKWRFLFT